MRGDLKPRRTKPRTSVCELAIVAVVAAILWAGPAQAEEPTAISSEAAGEAPEGATSDEAGSTEPQAPEEAQARETLGGIPEHRSLRFVDRRQILAVFGFGGRFRDTFFQDNPKAKASYGVTLRWDRPVHEYVTTGIAFSFYASQPEGGFREPTFDIGYLLKGRFPFEMGKGERKFESEVYALFQIGLTIWIDSTALLDLIGPGWHVGTSVGYQFFINDRVGLLAEVGWARTQAYFSRGRYSILVNQAVVRTGAVFPF